jgi:serine/threonine-protein kinase
VKLLPGTLFARDFRVTSSLAEGGMGEVYVVEQLSTGKRRALKVMQPQLIPDARARERFVLEARIGSQIESEHVVDVVASGIDEHTGMPWIAMELLEGVDLADHVQARGHLSPAETYEVLAQLCEGLGAAHARGIVHRDLKPENVFISTSKRRGVPFIVKILDFGIAKVTQDNHTSATSTSAMGSPLWMAPEQTESGTRLRPSTDVWALGLMAFWMLTGRVYWRAGNQSEIALTPIFTEVLVLPLDPPSVRAAQLGLGHLVPPAFDAWFFRCVTRDHDQRFVDATQAFAALSPHFSLIEASSARRMIPATIAMPSIPPEPASSSLVTTPIPRGAQAGPPTPHYLPHPTEPTPPFSVPAILGGSLPPGVPIHPAHAMPSAAPNAPTLLAPQPSMQAVPSPVACASVPVTHHAPAYEAGPSWGGSQQASVAAPTPAYANAAAAAPYAGPSHAGPSHAGPAYSTSGPSVIVPAARGSTQGVVRWGVLGAVVALLLLGAGVAGVAAFVLFRRAAPVTPPPRAALPDAAVLVDAALPPEDAGLDAGVPEAPPEGVEPPVAGGTPRGGEPRTGQPRTGEPDVPPEGDDGPEQGEPLPDGADRRFTGSWSGEGWRYRLMIDLSRDGAQVSGAIRWTLAETPDELYTARIGETATEYVRGTFSAPGLVALDGQSVTDDSLISADHYDLHLAEDGSLVGVAREGGGRLSARMLD